MIQYFIENQRNKLTSKRDGEIKLGEEIEILQSLDDLNQSSSKFVLLGIREDIGIRANCGIGGASTCWDEAIKALFNVQSNRFLSGKDLAIAGTLEFDDILKESAELNSSNANDLKKLREFTSIIDNQVSEVIHRLTKQNKIPIIIGGGHNNAYGNISGSSKALDKAIPVLNIDPHTDFRKLEGRHSGNGFSYAFEEGKLSKYAVYGLHEGYNGEGILNRFEENPNLFFQSFESLLWRDTKEQDQLFKNVLNWLGNEKAGLELDLDSISNFPVSALNPSGFQLNEVRNLVRTFCSIKEPLYFHICEGSPGRAANQQQIDLMAKSIAYLITDFAKCSLN